MSTSLPKGFAALEPLTEEWGLPTQNARQAKRRNSSTETLQEFYDAVVPLLPKILAHVDEFPMGELPPDSMRLFYLSLALAEGAMGVFHGLGIFEHAQLLQRNAWLEDTQTMENTHRATAS